MRLQRAAAACGDVKAAGGKRREGVAAAVAGATAVGGRGDASGHGGWRWLRAMVAHRAIMLARHAWSPVGLCACA